MLNAKRIGAVLTSAALLLSSAMPAFAQGTTNLTITGNGSESENEIISDVTRTNTVVQSNSATVTNSVIVNGVTGDNSANDTTNGSVSINTGDATARVTLNTTANVNRVSIPNCNTCDGGNLNATITGNGSESDSDITVTQDSTNTVFQDNYANITNNVFADLITGDNEADGTTGGSNGGDVSILTGNAGANVAITNKANANLALLGGNANSNASAVNLTIEGNGSESENEINLDRTRTNTLTQDNYANIFNDVTVAANTGDNEGEDTTNGDVDITTGDTAAILAVTNQANFNVASVDCGCTLTDNKTIGGNGSESENEINQTLDESLTVFQGNPVENGPSVEEWLGGTYLTNYFTLQPDTGANEAEGTTGGNQGGDVDILTGHSGSQVTVNNQAGANLFGNVALTFDLGEIFGLWGV